MRLCTYAWVLGVVLWTASAFAQAEEGAGSDRAQSFQAVEGAVKEDVPGGPLLVGAYGLIWLVVFGYLVRLVRQQTNTEAAIARLEQSLGASDPGATDK